MERLQKILQRAGVASRRKAEELITAGKVEVNGEVVTVLGSKANFDDEITVEGKRIKVEDLVYYLLYKPEGYVSTTNDQFNRLTVMDLLPIDKKVFPVGRLDYNTSGALIMTNDGTFANILMHPQFKLEKEYYVKVKGLIRKETSRDICRGVDLGDFITQKAKIFDVKYDEKKENTFLNIVITEGKYHQVKRMMAAVGNHVVKLHRHQIGRIELDADLKAGEWRKLTEDEINLD